MSNHLEIERIEAALREGFGNISLRTRRPRQIYQLEIPAWMSDGDGAQIYIQLRGEGRVSVTDLGTTATRLSYLAPLSERNASILSDLAEAQGFDFIDGRIEAAVGLGEIVPAVLGLLQVETVAEEVIEAPTARESAKRFVTALMDELDRSFPGQVTRRPRLDDEGLWEVDALVELPRPVVVVAVASNAAAEQAVAAHAHLHDKVSEGKAFWTAVPRDIAKIKKSSQRRLRSAFHIPIAEFEPERETMAAKIRQYGKAG